MRPIDALETFAGYDHLVLQPFATERSGARIQCSTFRLSDQTDNMEEFMEFRRPTPDEARLLRELARIAGITHPDVWLEGLRVREMDDGGMGSLELEAAAVPDSDRTVVTCRAAVQFADADGVEVIASLNARGNGVPFELEMWKTDFSKLVRLPDDVRPLEE